MSFAKLPKYMWAIMKYNPGTIVELDCEPIVGADACTFKRMFWAYKPAIDAFRHCRPVMSIDATFLTGKYLARLFLTMGMDSSNHILPIAFAIVETESHNTWS